MTQRNVLKIASAVLVKLVPNMAKANGECTTESGFERLKITATGLVKNFVLDELVNLGHGR